MSAHCHHDHDLSLGQITHLARYRAILWVALMLNAGMFALEIAAGIHAGSLSLLADAVDFAGDALNYGVSLAVLAAALHWRARAALVKSLSMMGFGLYVLGHAVWSIWHGGVPEAMTMGVVATLALVVNVAVAAMLYAFREGDANMRSVWLCSRNDAIGNVAVMLAALGVFGTGSAWPDLLVASLMAALALQGGWLVLRQARAELRHGAAVQAQPHRAHGCAHGCTHDHDDEGHHGHAH
ncbi:cation transporter [Hylemonella gracilis]|uniref:Cation efflux protein n=1 Tax=Hylemonella gracilis ATCC 19624 TaxID=887062 RepID=F3KQD0_9BURK|nr:cation transporter [Hylemonella gracilis]EGI78003.1 cation efflux protein [Hylemonella gracilis ATCC 19624]